MYANKVDNSLSLEKSLFGPKMDHFHPGLCQKP